MSIELPPLLLAFASSLLPESLGATTVELSLGDPYSLLMLLAVAPSIVMLVILGIYRLGGSRRNDEPGNAAKPSVDAEPENLGRFMRDAIEQLNNIAAELRNTIPEAGQAPGREVSSMTGPGGSRGAATPEESRSERVGTLDESVSRSDPLPPPLETTHSVTHAKALAQLVAKMRKLTELAKRMEDERQAQKRDGMDPDDPAPSRHYLTFSLGDEQFALSTLNIHGVVEAMQLVAEPSIPPKIRKAISLRGALVPVIDLAARFGGQPIEIGWSSRIVILEVTCGERLQTIGVVVDAVGKVLQIAPAEIEAPAVSGSRIRDDFTLGTTMLDNRPVTLLDIGRGFSANELVVLRSAARSAKQEIEPV